MKSQTLVKEICPTTTMEWIKSGAVLVDVREIDEVEELAFDVPHMIHIPLSQFEERFSEISMHKIVIVACKLGGRSLRAAGFLINHDYPNVVNLQNGITKWVQKGFPTKGNISSITDKDSCCSAAECC